MAKMEEMVKLIHDLKEEIEKLKTDGELKELIEKTRKEFELKLAEVARKAPDVGNDNVKAVTKEDLEAKSADPFVKRCQEIWDKAMIAAALTKKSPFETKVWEALSKQYPEETKALSAGVAGSGADFVPTGYSRRLWEDLVLSLNVASLHEVIDMPTNPYKFPVSMVDAVAYLVPESTTDVQASNEKAPATSFTTAEFTLTAKKLGTRIVISEELNEDALVSVLDIVQRRITRALQEAIENAIINGDDSATPIDADLTSASDPRKAFKGYRALAPSSANVDFGGVLNGDNILTLRSKMGKYGIKPDDIAMIVSIQTYYKLLNLKDANGNPLVITRDKYGAQATVFTGELGKIFGIPIIVSPFVREDLNTSGVYDGVTTTSTIVILVNKGGFVIGNRRELTLKVVEYQDWDQRGITAFLRIAFNTPFAGKEVVAVGYNIPA